MDDFTLNSHESGFSLEELDATRDIIRQIAKNHWDRKQNLKPHKMPDAGHDDGDVIAYKCEACYALVPATTETACTVDWRWDLHKSQYIKDIILIILDWEYRNNDRKNL